MRGFKMALKQFLPEMEFYKNKIFSLKEGT